MSWGRTQTSPRYHTSQHPTPLLSLVPVTSLATSIRCHIQPQQPVLSVITIVSRHIIHRSHPSRITPLTQPHVTTFPGKTTSISSHTHHPPISLPLSRAAPLHSATVTSILHNQQRPAMLSHQRPTLYPSSQTLHPSATPLAITAPSAIRHSHCPQPKPLVVWVVTAPSQDSRVPWDTYCLVRKHCNTTAF
jgi:hypothetical protein